MTSHPDHHSYHEIGVCDVMFDEPAAQDDHPGPLGEYGKAVDFTNV